MFWFDLLFPPLMIIMPLTFCLILRPPAGVGQNEPLARRMRRWMVGGTIAALAAFGIVWLLAGREAARHCWFLSAPLFALMIPHLNISRPDWRTHDPAQVVRSASLVNRPARNPVPRAWWSLLWIAWLTGLAAVVARALQPMDQHAWGMWVIAMLCAAAALLPAIITPWVVRRAMEEPEPMDESNSSELRAAYARHRRFRAWGFAVFGLVMTVMAAALPAAIVWMPRDPSASAWGGAIGGGIGALVGLGGAVFGTMCTLRRARITRLLNDLQSRGSPSAGTVHGGS
jgi:hypothetical protein